MKERFRWLAGAIAAHKERKVVGRTRLQKEIKLLQRLGFPTEYSYTLFFYGPYSEALQAEIGFLQAFGLVTEEERSSQQGDTYFVLTAAPEAVMPEMVEYQHYIDLMQNADAVVLELAATYDMFRTMKSNHEEAMMRLRRKKGSKCDNGNDTKALELLRRLVFLHPEWRPLMTTPHRRKLIEVAASMGAINRRVVRETSISFGQLVKVRSGQALREAIFARTVGESRDSLRKVPRSESSC